MKVIIAIDQTEYASQVIDAVLRRRWPKDTCFKILTVLEPLQWEHLHSTTWQKTIREVFAKRQNLASQLLAKESKRLEQQIDDCTVHVEVRVGSARTEILAAAIEWMADKIMVGAHGHSPNRLFGSIPQSLAQHAPCSIEIVRLKRPFSVLGQSSDDRTAVTK